MFQYFKLDQPCTSNTTSNHLW